MRYLLASLFFILTAAQIFGGEPNITLGQYPNTLTPEEIRQGWLLLFDGETAFGWHSARAKVVDATLQLEKAASISTSSPFGNFELRFQFRLGESGAPEQPAPALSWFLLMNGHEFHAPTLVSHGEPKWSKELALMVVDGTVSLRYTRLMPNPIWRTWFKLPEINGPGAIGFACKGAKASSLRNVKLLPLGAKPLFNGKDLTGWKTFPGKKSKFEVKDGALTLTNGPGDLQTVGKYRDFILQLECKSNGKHLNSGVFFRCRDGEYQNGYEAQIRNQFTAEPKQVYTIEEYDPKTHELVGKKKVKYTAIDYGTGAIYRRQPARREVARDGEWFTMTILAHGNHFATWVNGIQVTDWTDNRPPSNNARTGFRREAGHLSLQGHDPTTNLSFRNFRIAELK
jgi:hypothetical protein